MGRSRKYWEPWYQMPDARYQIPDPPTPPRTGSPRVRHLGSGIRYLVSRSLIFAVLVCALSVSSGASALEVPYLAGRVNDQANMLEDGFEAQLEERLRLLEEETGAQVAVLTISTLEGDPLEDFSMRVVETWKLGREDADNGVLILIARDERRMRIEVGYGLEGALTDAQSGRIIDHLMAPRFREGDFNGGVGAAVDAVSSAIRGEPVELPEKRTETGGFNPGSFIFLLIFGLPFIGTALSARGAAGWIVGIFLTPFFFAFPAAIFGVAIGKISAIAWLIAFPALRLILPKKTLGGGTGSRGGAFWGPFIGGGGGGGFSGGGFSGGGGSFGGGGASGGW
jgi:uncharacterized protein